MRQPALIASLLLFLGIPAAARAEVRAFEIIRREPFAGGAGFGDAGPYEKITGIVRFAVDPRDPHNRVIVDLERAPRSSKNKVEFAADVCILAPKDVSRGNGALFYDVNNRGNKLALRFFNTPPGGPVPEGDDAGDGFLMRQGFTVVWSGWIGELLPGDGRLLLQPPRVYDDDRLVRGLVRFETVADKPAQSMPLSRRDHHGSYAPTTEGEASAVLTKRLREKDPRQEVPRSAWRLVRMPLQSVQQGVSGTLAQVRLELKDGFEPGYLYELVCECEGPIVQGLGLAGVRDLISFLRYDRSERNPLRSPDVKLGFPVAPPSYTRALAFGVSQSGRFLRQFLYQGFNTDEKDRVVFEGLMPHVAGGGLGFFNHRFAQPTRHNGQHEEHLYPADVFPFTYGPSLDPFTKRADSVLAGTLAAKRQPKVMHTQSAAEYWHRAGSLVHTDPLGTRDEEVPANVRIYSFGGTQHGPAIDPPPRGIGANLNNPADYRPFLRALLLALDRWVVSNKAPPASAYPRLADGTLVDAKQESTGFPKLPGVRYPQVIQQPSFCDFGPDFRTTGIITREPPKLLGDYKVLVPRSDADGNDRGTLNLPDVAVPLATYTGWNLRSQEAGATDELASLLGSYLPFPRTKAERARSGDPRQSLDERYASFEAYRDAYARACAGLVQAGYLRAEDAERLIANRMNLRDRFAHGDGK
jgi:hypothetical protein